MRRAALLCLLMVSGAARAEGTEGPRPAEDTPEALRRPLSLADCVRLAESATPTAEAFRARLLAARADVTTAATWPNPVAAYQGQDLGDPARVLHQATLTYPLFHLVTRTAATAAAREGQARAAAAVETDRRLLRLDVGRVYYDLLQQEELVRVEAEAVTLAAGVTSLVGQRRVLGDASVLDVDRAQAEELEARRTAELVTRRRDVDRLALSITLGAERPVQVELVPGWPGELPAELGLPGLTRPERVQRLVQAAVAARPDLRQAEAAVRQADAVLSFERRRTLPLADVLITGGVRVSPPGLGGFVAATVPLPLLDFNQGPRRRALAAVQGAAAEREAARRRVALEVETALTACEGARRALAEIVRPLVATRERVLVRTRGLFVGGEVGFLDLLTAQRDLLAARRALVQAERDAALERWRLIQAVGR